ncbi:MAG TPA: histidine kinase dimerization/phosphoacceptor domain-containing protein, partial [Candidatus Dormibacteraeota bacterium]
MNRRGYLVILLLGLAVSALATAGALTATLAPPTVTETVLHVACGMSFIGVGLLAWSRRPENRIGMLMTAAGFAWFLADLRYIPGSLSFTAADYAGRTLFYAIVAHLFLAFPSGHLRSRADRIITVAVYLWIGLSNLGPEAFFAAPAGGPLPDNLLAIYRDAHLHTLAGNAHQVANVALSLLVFGVVLAHWANATPPGRRALAPVCLASGPIVVAVVSLNAVGVVEQMDWLNTILPTMTPLLLMTLPFAFLVGLIRSGLDRIAVGHLVVELGETQPPGHLRDALALTLHDPSLQLVYWLDGTEGYVDAVGNPVELPARGSDQVVTLLEREGQPVAALLHDPSLEDDPWLIDAVAAAACLAVENERLHADLAAQLAEVRASRARILEAGDAERRRVERDLHDGAQQRMVSLALALRLAVDQVGTAPDEAVRRSLTVAADQLRQALAELRELVNGLHPAVLTEGG